MKSNTIILFITFIKIIFTEICNFSFSCDLNEEDNICAVKKRTDSNSIYEIKVRKCPSMPCNIYDTLLGDTEKKTFCQDPPADTPYKYPSYPGGVCNNTLNCLSGICLNNQICINSLNNECLSHENCPLNTACINGSCKAYLKINEDCDDSYQCEYDAFCNKTNNKCAPLFSVPNGVEITEFTFPEERIENICESGDYITQKDKNGVIHRYCETLKNVNNNCNDVCKYTMSNDSEYISEERCLCGFNKYRSKFCVLGNGEEIFKNYLEIKKNFVKNKDFTKFCHTLERNMDDICFELINTNKTVIFRNYLKEYNNKKILALEHHRLQESESCIKEVLFNYDTSPVFSVQQKCPKFSCNTKKENCFYGYNPLQENGENITITLNPNSCNEKEFCTLPENSQLINTCLIMKNEYLEGQCKIFQGQKGIKRYPGEQCNINSDCIVENSICSNGNCTGFKVNEKCNETKQCIVGLFCDKEQKICVVQKNEGEKCKEAWDCKNYLGCFKGRCIKFGSLKKGIKVTQEFAPFPGEDRRNYLCYTGELNEGDGSTGEFCVENNYDKNWLDGKDLIEDKYVKCNYGEECIYNNGKNKTIKKCECGYNSKGQGYCPLPSARNPEKWKARIEFIGDSANNGCHSLSRFNCYKNNHYEFYVKQREHESNTTEAHLFYGCVDCAYKMFIKQNNIKFNYYIIVLFLALLI